MFRVERIADTRNWQQECYGLSALPIRVIGRAQHDAAAAAPRRNDVRGGAATVLLLLLNHDVARERSDGR